MNKDTMFTKTLKARVWDKHAKVLRRQTAAVNRFWNLVNELSHRIIRERNAFLSAYDLPKYTTGDGSGRQLGLQFLRLSLRHFP